MTSLGLSAQIDSASFVREDGGDPRPAALELLRELRVLAALRDAHAPWREGEEAFAQVAVSGDGAVLTLSDEGTITGSVLRVSGLHRRFEAAGLVLSLTDPDAEEVEFDDREYSPEEVSAPLDDLDEETLAKLFAPTAVKVREFSHRAPMTLRMLAPLVKADIDYAEEGEWSVAAYETTETSPGLAPSAAESPVITLNLLDDVDNGWIDVRTPREVVFGIPFWPNLERDTVPVLDLDSFAVPAAAETYRMLLTEGDGMRDELEELAARCSVDVGAAHAALIPVALGGVEGAENRIRAFLRAFGVPETLIEAALADAVAGLPRAERFEARGFARAIGEVILGGTAEAVALTRRERPLARLSRWIRDNPLLGLGIAVAELAAGILAAARLHRGGKVLGILLIADALGDLLVLLVRARRR